MQQTLFYDLLACPVHGNKLHYDAKDNILINQEHNIFYSIENGIPILLPDAYQKYSGDSESNK